MAELSVQSNYLCLMTAPAVRAPADINMRDLHVLQQSWEWAVRWMSRVWRKVETITLQSTQEEAEASTVSAAQLLVDSKMPGEVSKCLAAHLPDWTNSKKC